MAQLELKEKHFFCTFKPAALVEAFYDAPNELATQSKAQMKSDILEIRSSVKKKLYQFFSAPNQRRCRTELVLEFEYGYIEGEEEQDMSIQNLQTEENQLNDLQESYCNFLPGFGFNSAKKETSLKRDI